jgi:sterol desaturase/sphingolipid hydroxylase (fatty acid hydroxylase superfamily)
MPAGALHAQPEHCPMGLMSIEHTAAAVRADFAIYAAAALALAGALAFGAPAGHGPALLAAVVLGGAGWTALEYALHRWVLHGLRPFSDWHALHHLRPRDHLGTPTVVSAPLFGGLVFAPAWALAGPWVACAVVLGLLLGYLGYSAMHLALHHPARHPGARRAAWLGAHARWHARHHGAAAGARGCYGVTTRVWDKVFGTAG